MKIDLNLPAPVLERIGGLTEPRDGLACLYQRASLTEERRQLVELRAGDDGSIGIHGYASVTEVAYDVAGGPDVGGWSETVARGAFAKSLAERDDVRLLVNHEGLPLARTASKTLTLEEDEHGLVSEALSLDPTNPTVAELRSVLARGDADQMSFAFRTIRQEWDEEYLNRRILEVKLYDVSVVTYPANPATVVGLRSDPIEESPGFPLSLALAQRDQLALR